MKKKYFIYTRVSKDDYKDSISNQLDILKKIAQDKGIPDYCLEIIEENKTGSGKSERAKFDEMISKLEIDSSKKENERVYGGVLFFKIDRLSRNYDDFGKIEHLLNCGYKFISATETIESTPTGRLLFRMISSFAIFESEKLSNRQSIAQIHNIIKSDFKKLGGQNVFGYKFNKSGKMIIDKEQADIVNKIYDLTIQGKKPGEIFKEHGGFLEKYCLKNKIKSSDFVGKIQRNNNWIQYNGSIRREINVNDELIENYIKTIKEENYDFEMFGTNKINDVITFIFPLPPELIIINDIKYKQVQSKLEKRNKKEKSDNFLFNNILFFDKNNTIIGNRVSEKKGVKNTTKHYRIKNLKYGDVNISERKLEDILKNKGDIIFSKLQNFKLANENLKTIKNLATTGNIQIKKSLNIKKIVYEREIKWADLNIENLKEVDKIQFYLDQKNEYIKSKEECEEKLNLLDKQSIKIIEGFLGLFKGNIFNKKYKERKLLYEAIFDKMIYNRQEDKITLQIKEYICEILGIHPEIII